MTEDNNCQEIKPKYIKTIYSLQDLWNKPDPRPKADYENPWMVNDEEFTDEDIHDFVGFVYLITNLTNNRKYIGKKIFEFTRRIKRKNKIKRKVTRKPSNWKEYYGSCDELINDINLLGKNKFKREILYLCNDKSAMTLLETKELFENKVLETSEFYNTNILGKFFIKDKTKAVTFFKNLIYGGKPGKRNINKPKIKKARLHINKKNMSEIMKKYYVTDAGKLTKEKIRKKLLGTEHSKETIEKRANKIRGIKRSPQHIMALTSARIKTWKIIYPNNEEIIIKNLAEFCRNNNLSASNLIKTQPNGKLKHHKGFRCVSM